MVRQYTNDRDEAFITMYKLRYKYDTSDFHVGISSSNIPMIDIDINDMYLVFKLAYKLSRKYNCDVGIFKTEKGYHLVLLRKVNNLRKFYYELYKTELRNYVDNMQFRVGMSWGENTLRISKKSKAPKLIAIVR